MFYTACWSFSAVQGMDLWRKLTSEWEETIRMENRAVAFVEYDMFLWKWDAYIKSQSPFKIALSLEHILHFNCLLDSMKGLYSPFQNTSNI